LKQQGLFNQKEESDTERNLQALKSLFYNYNADFDIKIGSISHHLNIELIHYREEIIKKEEGLIIQNDNIKVGVWLMPNNEMSGMIEDFINFLVLEADELLPIVKTHLENIESQKLNQYSEIHRSKAKIYSWLALQETSGIPVGLAITKRYLNTDEATCQVFIVWLRRLFD
jgi:hypothetical protein